MNRNIRASFLEHPFVSDNKTINRHYLVLYYFFFVLTILIVTQFDSLFLRDRYYGYREGDRVEETVYLDKSLSYIDENATEKKRTLAMEMILPVYIIKEDINEKILDQYGVFNQSLADVIANDFPPGEMASLEALYPGFQYLGNLRDIDSVRLNLMMSTIQDTLETLLARGVLSRLNDEETGTTGLIEIFRTEIGEKSTVLADKTLTIDNWQILVREMLSNYDFNSGELKFIELIVYYFLEPNCFYSEELTELKYQEINKTMTPVWVKVESGDTLLTRGTIITASELEKIDAVKNSRGRIRINSIISPFLYTVLVFLFLLILLIVFPSARGLLENPHLVFFPFLVSDNDFPDSVPSLFRAGFYSRCPLPAGRINCHPYGDPDR